MTYKVYIKQDYKAEVIWEPDDHRRTRLRRRLLASAVCAVVTLVGYSHLSQDNGDSWSVSSSALAHSSPSPIPSPAITANPALEDYTEPAPPSQPEPVLNTTLPETGNQPAAMVVAGTGLALLDSPLSQRFSGSLAEDAAAAISSQISEPAPEQEPLLATDWETVTVQRGDSMALIFNRLGLSAAELHSIMQLGDATRALRRIMPGQELRFRIEDKRLQALQYDPDAYHLLHIERGEDGFHADLVEAELTTRTRAAVATIDSSLFLAGQRAGLSDNLIMQLVALYGWDIDFAMDIRRGDQFSIIFQESWRDGVKVQDGPILAAEFINRNRTLRAVRYADEDGNADYYSDAGDSMRKAFIRTPIDVYRISSHFGPRRHPVLHSMRMHRGVDYAAPTGTPIRAAGDGRITHIGRKGGYGNTVVLRHGGRYSTLYAHMSRFASGLRNGSTVKQGQVIGYVGATGMATGPHLHYEFQVDGVHKDPLKVELPQAESIAKDRLPAFKRHTAPLLAELDILQQHDGHMEIADIALDEAVLIALNGGDTAQP